ncbi:MAG: hypothetical protein A3J93_03475 [Candidatus Magasanikbacteria bacterium RIFOXYC2_FULL_42_28]|uniref:Uncharacterized protein n=1 Tax=Candidatus Magasanikbacteria bacterium RIFOXYC2_FULL_42_28 TaxID=1798704 RepID=A0A1F6NUL5_9BACT|nr:MAG: hypothetical protein A3J93_03475 [Candidatus Magasanikbacteria bacterium RIFOXYC2_FULL_42_28]
MSPDKNSSVDHSVIFEKAKNVANLHLESPRGIMDNDKRQLETAIGIGSPEGLFKLTPEATMVMIENSAEELAKGFSSAKFLELARFLIGKPSSNVDGSWSNQPLLDALDKVEKGDLAGIQELEGLYEKSKHRDEDEYTGDSRINSQVLIVAKTVAGQIGAAQALREIARASSYGSMGQNIGTAANRKILEMALRA